MFRYWRNERFIPTRTGYSLSAQSSRVGEPLRFLPTKTWPTNPCRGLDSEIPNCSRRDQQTCKQNGKTRRTENNKTRVPLHLLAYTAPMRLPALNRKTEDSVAPSSRGTLPNERPRKAKPNILSGL